MNETTLETSNKVVTVMWNMDDPYAKQDFNRTMKADDLCSAIFDMTNMFRRFEDDESMDEKTVDEIKKEFYSILNEHGINIDEIYS